jgi:peptide/nickel transport system permease protein
MFMAFPSLVIIPVAAAMGPSVYNAMLVIGLLTWPSIARLVRGQFLTLREQQFVRAARSIGTSSSSTSSRTRSAPSRSR